MVWSSQVGDTSTSLPSFSNSSLLPISTCNCQLTFSLPFAVLLLPSTPAMSTVYLPPPQPTLVPVCPHLHPLLQLHLHLLFAWGNSSLCPSVAQIQPSSNQNYDDSNDENDDDDVSVPFTEHLLHSGHWHSTVHSSHGILTSLKQKVILYLLFHSEMRKLSLREMKQVTQGHLATTWASRVIHASLFTLVLINLTLVQTFMSTLKQLT